MSRPPEHPWLPRASCTAGCVAAPASASLTVAARIVLRVSGVLLLAPALPLLAVPLPHLQRGYCRLVLRCFGVRITVSGGPIRNLRSLLVVSGHVSWVDVFAIGAVLPGSFVARADLVAWPAVGIVARILKVIPIERASLRRLPAVVDAVAARLRAGHTVVAFPEGTTWCGLAGGSSHQGRGPFYPAMFQAAIDAARPVQPLRLSYHHPDGAVSTVPAFIGDDTLLRSMRRLVATRRTVAHVHVASLQLPGTDRRDLARRCQTVVRTTARPRRHRLPLAG
jgi:1-acyl-sn-glycerol-3-phosphate acyltransferase